MSPPPTAEVRTEERGTEQTFVRVRPTLVGEEPTRPVEVVTWTCDPVRDVDPQGLDMTYWFDAAESGDPYPVAVKFTGRRLSAGQDDGRPTTFEQVQRLERVVPGSGRIALSARTPAIPAGEWEVTATPLTKDAPRASGAGAAASLLPTGVATGRTLFLPAARVVAPGVRIGAWPSLVSLGAVVALALQAVLAGQEGLPALRLFLVSAVACLIGLAGAKTYYVVTHPREKGGLLRAGMSVQGFVLAAIATLAVGSWLAGIPLARALDVTAPGLLFGMTIGRMGCFLGGCCAGLPTASRWGIWSSDRTVGVRRIPVQLMESTLAGVVATSTLLAVLFVDPPVDGLFLVAGLSAYVAGRQILFPLRGIPRATSWGRVTTLAIAMSILGATLAVLFVASLG